MTVAGSVLLTSLPLLVALYANRYCEEDKQKVFQDNPSDLNLPVEKHYDFIVVGSGAGSIVARRLSDAGFSTLLLEAGGNPPPITKVPMVCLEISRLPGINYLYTTVKQQRAALGMDGFINLNAGKMMGGSTSRNAMIYNRGNPRDYDHWAELAGDPSWRYENILKFFLRAEKYMGKFPLNGQHNKNGSMAISRPSFGPGRSAWLRAGRQLNYSINDPNGPQDVGFSPIEFFISGASGVRESTYSAYIQPVEKGNRFLTVERYAVASQVLFDEKNVATGVLYMHHNVPRVARASKEVILSAGTYLTPMILINSGIGPKNEVTKTKARHVADLPVGKNLLDHPSTIVPFSTSSPQLYWDIETYLTFDHIQQFMKTGQGPVVSPSGNGIAQAFIVSPRAKNDRDGKWPDLQLMYLYNSRKPYQKPGFYIYSARAKSVGSITLNATALGPDGQGFDLDSAPIIDLNYFDNDLDLEIMVDAIEFLERVIKTPAFKRFGAKWSPTINKFPRCLELKVGSREYWKCYVKHASFSGAHVCGTCRMGKANDPRSVVDSKLRVLGVHNLRVADASIMPVITNANTAAPVVAIGEKAAALILEDYGQHKRHLFPLT